MLEAAETALLEDIPNALRLTRASWRQMVEANRPNHPVDAPERVAAEIREAEISRLAAIVEWSEDAIILKDLQGRIVEWNRSAERLFGYRREEAIGRSVDMLMPPDRADDWRKILERMLNGERIAHFETRRMARDGRILDVSLTVSPVRDREGRIVGASKVVRDVTAEREASRESEKTRELFLGMLSHDLQNPLSTINVSVHTLRRHASEADQKVLARISNSAGRMSRMIDQLLDITRSRLGPGIPIHPEDADLHRICQTVADEFEVLHPGRIRVSADGDLRGLWDSDRLTEVLSNLVANAFKYGTPEEKVAIGASTSGKHVLLEVTNQGPEIPESLLPTIFDPFQRGAIDHHRGTGGLGLGLYIAREIVCAHRGEITVRSGAGETTFSVRLPRRAPPPPAATDPTR